MGLTGACWLSARYAIRVCLPALNPWVVSGTVLVADIRAIVAMPLIGLLVVSMFTCQWP
jgi:hypothetical protein